MSDILFIDKKNGRFYRDDLTWDKKLLKKATKARIIFTKEELILEPKIKSLKKIIIPINQIKTCKWFKEPIGLDMQHEILLKDDSKIHIIFLGQNKLNFDFQSALLQYVISPRAEKHAKEREEERKELIEDIKVIKKLADAVYITIPPKTKLSYLKCPACDAPLEFMPPCKCEHCGVMIEIAGPIVADSITCPKCPKCQTKIPKFSKFCLECGNKISS